MRIGVFDSGIGGLNVLNELINKYPFNEYIYYGDTLNVPYGNKTKEEVTSLSLKIIEFFKEKKVDLIVIACGTISCSSLEEIKNSTVIKVIDILSPTINYLNNSNFRNIGILATLRTIESGIFDKNLINKNIIKHPPVEYVNYIENNKINENIDNIKKELDYFNNIDCLVLGCTHYPLLSSIIYDYLKVPLINMGKCLVESINLTNNTPLKVDLYFTKLNSNTLNNINKIITVKHTINLI